MNTTVQEATIIDGRKLASGPLLNQPHLVAEACRQLVGNDPREHFVVLALDGANQRVAAYVASIGTLEATLVHPREVFRFAILAGASRIVVAHNHPSGNVEPSPEDRLVTTRLRKGGAILGITLVDHVVFSDSSYWSMLERDELDREIEP